MVRRYFLLLSLLLGLTHFWPVVPQEKKDFKVVSIAFYNVENLFDTFDDPQTFDEDFTPSGKNRWTADLYQKKLKNISLVLSQIGQGITGSPPVLIGLSEVENRQVLEDLVKMPLLAPYGYEIIHFDSPDERGIDVALLYRAQFYTPLNAVKHSLMLFERTNTAKRDFSRDQLAVSGILDGEALHVIVNHWPSRSGGEKASSYKRESAARLNLKIIDSLHRTDPYARIINMGDFNDDPLDHSLSQVLCAKAKKEQVGFKGLYNPFMSIAAGGTGTSAYRDQWNLFDQIMVSKPLIEKDPAKFTFYRAYVFNEPFLVTPSGAYKNYPFRSFGNSGFTGGFSDHFPVYILLTKQID